MGKEMPVTLSTTSFSFTSQMSTEALPCTAGGEGGRKARVSGREMDGEGEACNLVHHVLLLHIADVSGSFALCWGWRKGGREGGREGEAGW